MIAAGVRPGDEVITVPFTFVATAWAVSYVGARPVFVDIEPRSCNLDVEKLAAAIGPKTRAILPVHLYGQMADLDPIRSFVTKRGCCSLKMPLKLTVPSIVEYVLARWATWDALVFIRPKT
jgi:dTDP-4-amino-4,6-dideoxygalactose transaminase